MMSVPSLVLVKVQWALPPACVRLILAVREARSPGTLTPSTVQSMAVSS